MVSFPSGVLVHMPKRRAACRLNVLPYAGFGRVGITPRNAFDDLVHQDDRCFKLSRNGHRKNAQHIDPSQQVVKKFASDLGGGRIHHELKKSCHLSNDIPSFPPSCCSDKRGMYIF